MSVNKTKISLLTNYFITYIFIRSSWQKIRKDSYTQNPFREKGRIPLKPSLSRDDEMVFYLKKANGKYDRTKWKILPYQELNDPFLWTPVENLRQWVISSNEQKTHVSGFSFSNEQKWGSNPMIMMDLQHTHTHYIHNLNMEIYYKPPLCDLSTSTIRMCFQQPEIKRI